MTVFSDTFDKNTPPGGGNPSEADDRMREIKAAVQERMNVDGYWPLTGTEVSDEDAGEQRKLTIRTLTVDEVTALSATKAYLYRLVTDGELYFKDASDNTIKLTVGGILNSLNLTGDQTAVGDKIFGGVIVLGDGSALGTDAAPTEDEGIANKKFVVDQDIANIAGIVQIVNTQIGAVATGTSVIPFDDSIPQKTEGTEFMTLAITPTNASNKLVIEVIWHGSDDDATPGESFTVALFQDDIANALAVCTAVFSTTNRLTQVILRHYMTAGTTAAITFKVRAGTDDTTTTTFNGRLGARNFGGKLASSITITEIKV